MNEIIIERWEYFCLFICDTFSAVREGNHEVMDDL